MASESIVVCGPSENRIKIHKWKVREGFQVTNNQVILLYELIDSNDKEIKRFKVNKCGVVKKRLFNDGDTIEKEEPILELSACIHTTVIKDMCADCGSDLRQDENIGKACEASVPMVHSVPELKVTKKLAQKLGRADTLRLLEDRKLVLLVDLDQTLIHTTNDNIPNNIKSVYHFQLYGPNSPWYHTRLRPGTFQFLSNMAPHYELHICTFGARNYAHMIAQFLDEDGKYFSHRILSRNECFNATSKTDNLSALFPCGDSMVCIIDDREDVWNMASNLIQVKPYHFFQHTGDINAPPGMSKHELDGKGATFEDLLSGSTGRNDKSDVKKSDKASDDSTVVSNENSETIEKPSTNNEDEDSKSKSIATPQDQQQDDIPAKLHENSKTKETTTTTTTTSTTTTTTTTTDTIRNINSDSEDNLIEVEDPDDYLLYLETILKKIHQRFYTHYDATKLTPDLKILIPKIRNEVLIGKTLVFSGMVPNQQKLEQSRAYLIAKSLGANVRQQLTDDTTHLVAVTAGTFKVNAARKRTDIHVVTPDWLWSCAERWECVEEKIFPLDSTKSNNKMRQPPAHCHSPEHVVNYSEINECSSSSAVNQQNSDETSSDIEPKFIDTINPLMKFSNADLASMNQDFDQFFESDTSSTDDEPDDIENSPIDKKLMKKRRREEENEANESRKFFQSNDKEKTSTKNNNFTSETLNNDDSQDFNSSNCDSDDYQRIVDEEDEDEMPSTKFRRGEELPSDLDIGSDYNSADSNEPTDDVDDGDWNMMGAALEREFLGLE